MSKFCERKTEADKFGIQFVSIPNMIKKIEAFDRYHNVGRNRVATSSSDGKTV